MHPLDVRQAGEMRGNALVSCSSGKTHATAQTIDKQSQKSSFNAQDTAKAIAVSDCELQILMKL